MTISAKDLQTGEAAAHAYLSQALGWLKEKFVAQYEPGGVKLIVETADAFAGDVPAKEHAAGMAVYRQIANAGYASQVTSSQCAVLAHVVYQAVLKTRPAPAATA